MDVTISKQNLKKKKKMEQKPLYPNNITGNRYHHIQTKYQKMGIIIFKQHKKNTEWK